MTDVILAGKQAVFVAMWVANEGKPESERLPDYQVALNAGYSQRNARNTASTLLANPNIQRAIAERKQQLAKTASADVETAQVIAEWVRIAFADPTRITSVRRLNCRYCHGVAHQYQYTDAEFAKDSGETLDDALFAGVEADLSRFKGGPGFRKTREPHPDCPECSGEGIENVYVADMRKLPPELRRLVASVEQTKNGIKVTMRDQDAALAKIAQWLGLLVNKNEHSGPNGGPVPVAAVTYALPTDPQEASRAWQLLMEGKTV